MNSKKEAILDTSKVYYLSHPFTSYGNPVQNQLSAAHIQMELTIRYKINIINPIVLLPFGIPNDPAMVKCKHLYNACDVVILCPGWEQSTGCNEEDQWSINDGKPVYILNDKYELELKIAG